MLTEFLKNKKLIAGIATIALLLFILYASYPFIGALFGAGILAFIFHPLDKKLKKFGFSPVLSATIILIISLILIILPFIFIINGLIEQVSLLPSQLEKLKTVEENIEGIIGADIEINEKQLTKLVMPFITKSIIPIFTNIINIFIMLFLLFFTLFYFIIHYDDIKTLIIKYLPFSKENNLIIVKRFKEITNSTIIGTFLIAFIQGGLLAMNFYLLGIPNALFWGVVTIILSFLPVVGPPLIWGPAAFFLFISGNVDKSIAMLIIGILISIVDNILRPIINQKYGSIHPLVSIVGIYIGVSQFGIIGLFIGPLLIAYLILFWRLYIEEYFK